MKNQPRSAGRVPRLHSIRRLPIFLAVCLLALNQGDAASPGGNGRWTLVGWNNLGMHCMDDDYSVFSILPPYNTINAQLIDSTGSLVKTGSAYSVTYEAVADPDGSINRTSVGKSDFWTFAPGTYGALLAPELGLAGNAMPGLINTPQPMGFDGSMNWFGATGVPIIPIDDSGRANTYPMMKLVARNASKAVVAQASIVLPVSGEMDCRACHASTSGTDARPKRGWINDPNPKIDYRLNILLLHDEKNAADPQYAAALQAVGYRPEGLYATVTFGGTAVLCAACHSSEALGTASFGTIPPLTRSMHALHANVINPTNGLVMDSIANRTSCYQCHPGSTTRCLRGAMGASVAPDGSMQMQCQSCHGQMSAVGASTRTGWLDEPNCQGCHTGTALVNGGQIRFTSVFDTPGHMRTSGTTTFATNPDMPLAGKSLYRFSTGHGGLQCSACHGSTHAEFPSAHRNDNLLSQQIQGHVGVLTDCTACHAQPNTVTGGPHGMHPVGQVFVDRHPDLVGSGSTAQCKACHGTDYKGTVLSRMKGDRVLTSKFWTGTRTFYRGYQVSCYTCHNSPTNGDSASTHKPTVTSPAPITTPAETPVAIALASSAGSTLRIVAQPAHGTVALNTVTKVATYTPEAGFEGPDYFTFAASDGYADSTNLGVASISVGLADANLVKYALGLSMTSTVDNSAMPATSIDTVTGQKYLTMTLNRYFAPPDTSLAVQFSNDLITWTSGTAVTNTASQLKVRDMIGNAPRRFMRLQVTRP